MQLRDCWYKADVEHLLSIFIQIRFLPEEKTVGERPTVYFLLEDGWYTGRGWSNTVPSVA
jgi:hypothetical protein